MIARRESKLRVLISLLAMVLAIVIALIIVPEVLAQVPGANQPAEKNLLRSPQQHAPSRPRPVTRLQTELTVPATNSLAPSFGTGVYSSNGEYALSSAVGDLNGDGWPDLVVLNQCVRFFMACSLDGGSVSVLMGVGGGGFSGPTSYPTGGAYPSGVAIADVTGDGKPDVLVANSWGGIQFGEMLGNGDGSLQPVQPYSSSWLWNIPGASAMVDVNGDGILDLVALGYSTVDVQLGNGDGTYQSAVGFQSGGVYPQSILVADLNRDGKPDLVVPNLCANDEACMHSYSGTVGVLINAAPYTATTTTLVSSGAPTSVGHAVTFTASVTPNTGTLPDGEFITFKNGETVLGTAPLSAGTASLTTTAIPVGTFPITANYPYDGIYGASTAQLLHQVTTTRGYPTSLALTASPNPSYPGQTITFTAQVTSSYGPIPDGELLPFYNGKTIIGTGVTTAGVATFAISSLPAKTYAIKAIYSGDTTFRSSSGAVTQVANGYPTSTSLSSSLNPSTYGQAITFQVFVFPMSYPFVPPTGKVKFVWDRFTIGSATVTPDMNGIGSATFTISALNAASYPLTAVYSGDSMNAPGTSNVVNQLVLQATTAAAITSSANPSTLGQAVTFTASITSPTIIAKGPVTFTAGNTVLGTAQLSGGKAKLSISTLPVGTTTVTVTYQGNSNIAKSTASVTQVVQ